MARSRLLTSSVLTALAEQLRFAPKAAARRHVERAEQLATIIETDSLYPEDFIAQQITGFRPAIDTPALLPGTVVLADLGPLVERLCTAAAYGAHELTGPQWQSIEQVCAQLQVSRRTLERMRRAGLLSRRMKLTGGRGEGSWAVAFNAAVVKRFAGANAGRIAAAGKQKRLSGAERAAATESLRAAIGAGASRTGAARAVAAATGHSVATLVRATAKDAGEAGPRDRTLRCAAAWRAMHFGIRATEIARAWNCNSASVQRDADLHVLRKLLACGLGTPEAAANARAGGVALEEAGKLPAAFGEPGDGLVAEMVAGALALGWPDPKAERVLATAAWHCVAVASRALERISVLHPGTTQLDAVLTDLLTASRLRAELVRSQRRLLLETVKAVTGSELIEHDVKRAATLTDAAFAATAEAVGRFDPYKGGRLAAPAGLAMNRALIKLWDRMVNDAARPKGEIGRVAGSGVAKPMRAKAIEQVAAQPPRLRDWSREIDPWQFLAEPNWRAIDGAAALKPLWRTLLAQRFGWSRYGAALPVSLTELAALRGVVTAQIVRTQRAALREIVRARGDRS